jgi:hypothetical protein
MERIILSQKLLLPLPEAVLAEAVEIAGLLNDAVLNEIGVKAAVVNPAIHYTIWRYETQALAPSPNICVECDNHNSEVFELSDPDDLLEKFPYGEWLDNDTFAVNIHPHCHCLIVRDHDVYW